jgi:hypothetical protein
MMLMKKNKNYFHTYLKALSAIPLNGSSWPQYLQDQLIGSNVYSILDASGNNNHVDGNVVAVANLILLLNCIQNVLNQKEQQEQKQEEADNREKKEPEEPLDMIAVQILLEEPSTSIFNTRSISWARGHFLSRQFPDPRKNSNEQTLPVCIATSANQHQYFHNHLPGYGGETSILIPLLVLMNHTPQKKNACTVEMTQDGFLEVQSPEELPLKIGDEWFSCYGEKMSNKVLLQGYGFCLPNNQSDIVSVKITTDGDNQETVSLPTFYIGRGGASAIPSEMWKAIAGMIDKEDKDQSVEIGLGDLERLLQYMSIKLEHLSMSAQLKEDSSELAGSRDMNRFHWYV